MSLSKEIKLIRQKSLMTQTEFAAMLKVSFTTVNRWEHGRAKPNLSAMKEIKAFCERNNVNYLIIEKEWLGYSKEER